MKSRRSPDPPSQLRSIPFVGREEELAQLRTIHARALRGELSVVLLGGEAGAGKTRLATEFGEEVAREGSQFLRGQAVELQGADPFRPLVDILCQLLEIRQDEKAGPFRERLDAFLRDAGIDPGIFSPFLGELVLGEQSGGTHRAGSPELMRHILFEGIARLLQARARQRPVCLFLDDLQWADRVVFELLDYLLAEMVDARLLLLLAYRPEEISGGRDGHAHPLHVRQQSWVDRDSALYLEVGRLAEEAVHDLVDDLALDQNAVGDVFRRTEGLALFVAEYLIFCLQEGSSPGDVLPSRARQIIDHRLGRVAPEDRAMLRCASLLGERFDGELLAGMMGESTARIFLHLEQVCEVHRLLRREGETAYRFTHARIREALRAELPHALRRIYCLAAAEALEQRKARGHVFDLAFLFREGEDWPQAARYAALAARNALDQEAPDEAGRYAREALDLLKRVVDPPDAMVAEVCGTTGRELRETGGEREEILKCYDRALAGSGDPLDRADMHCRIADVHGRDLYTSGPFEEHLEAARSEIGEQTDTVQMARVCFRQAWCDDARFRLPGCLKALDLFERRAPNDSEIP